MPDVSNFGLAIGARGPAVLTYKQRLHDLHFDPGPIDQNFGQDLTYAIQAVQKLYGLPRSGRIDAITRIAISNFKFPKPLVKNGEADRVEIDLDRQVLVLWKNYQIILITTASTGSGEHFCGGADGCQYAVTPPGKFHLQYHFNGWKEGKLGKMWNPYFFNGGIAIHGLASVPPYPASHGCTRIPMDIATYFASLVSKDEAVYVVGAPSHTGPNPPPTVPPATTSSTSTSTTVPGTTTTVPRTTTTHPATTSTHPATTTTAPAPTTTT